MAKIVVETAKPKAAPPTTEPTTRPSTAVSFAIEDEDNYDFLMTNKE